MTIEQAESESTGLMPEDPKVATLTDAPLRALIDHIRTTYL